MFGSMDPLGDVINQLFGRRNVGFAGAGMEDESLRNHALAIAKQATLSELHKAAMKGDLKRANALLKTGDADVNARVVGDNFTPIFFAIIGNHVEIVDALIRNGADVNCKVKDGFTPLISAAQQGSIDIVKLLVKNNANIETATDSLNTSLHLAAEHGHLEVAKFLIGKGANLNATNNLYIRPLHLAAMRGRTEIVKLLIAKHAVVDAGASIAGIHRNKLLKNHTPLFLAAQEGHADVAKLLIQAGADVNSKSGDKMTPLLMACQNGHKEVVDVLIDNSCEVNCKDVEKATPLHLACERGHKTIVDALLKTKNINANAVDSHSLTPLHRASQLGHSEIIKSLLAYNVNKNPKTREDFTPLHLALQQKQVKASEVLIKNGAGIHFRDGQKWTPLHNACTNGLSVDIVKLLIDKGADVNSKIDNGRTALHMAAEYNHLKIVKCLVENGANVNAQDEKRWIPLHNAAYDGNLDVAKCLISRSSDVNAKSHPRRTTPLHFAVDHDHFAVAEALLKNGADVDCQDHTNWTSLHFATERGLDAMVELLLRFKANPNLYDNQKGTPLHSAAQHKHPVIIDILLKNGALVDSRMEKNVTPLHLAVQSGIHDSVKSLLMSGACFDAKTDPVPLDSIFTTRSGTPLDFAKKFGYSMIIDLLELVDELFRSMIQNDFFNVKKCIKKGAVVNARDSNGRTPLHYAVSNNNIDAVKFFLKNQADMFSVTSKGNTLLHLAVLQGHIDIAELLLRHAKKRFNFFELSDFVNAVTASKNTSALHVATQENNFLAVKLLLEHGAMYNMKNSDTKTPLQLTTDVSIQNLLQSVEKAFVEVKKNKSDGTLECLNLEKAVFNARDNEGGGTVLYWSASKGYSANAELLINLGADCTFVTKKGNTPVHIACSKGNDEIVKAIIERVGTEDPEVLKAFLNTLTTSEGTAAMHIASTVEVMKLLIQSGASYDVKNKRGETPLMLAKHDDVKMLLSLIQELFDMAEKGDSGIIGRLNKLEASEFITVTKAHNNQNQTLLQVLLAKGSKTTARMLANALKESDANIIGSCVFHTRSKKQPKNSKV